MSNLAIAPIGHNNPPMSPFEIAEKRVTDIYDETVLWLDGKTIDSKELADGIGNLLASIRAAEALADEARKAENKPFDDGKAEVQARYAPLIADTKAMKGKTVLAAAACKKALQPWLDAEDRRIKEAARLAREEADRKQREAEEAIRRTNAENLAGRAAAEALVTAAKKATTVANKAERQTATAGGAMGRATGLRTVYVPVLADPAAALAHYAAHAEQETHAFLQGLAERDVRAGRRDIPGFMISEERRAV